MHILSDMLHGLSTKELLALGGHFENVVGEDSTGFSGQRQMADRSVLLYHRKSPSTSYSLKWPPGILVGKDLFVINQA